ncbi:MAG: response regulator [Anaerolineae bacterium]|nr:response regulator [Anaerolineae bacterium]
MDFVAIAILLILVLLIILLLILGAVWILRRPAGTSQAEAIEPEATQPVEGEESVQPRGQAETAENKTGPVPQAARSGITTKRAPVETSLPLQDFSPEPTTDKIRILIVDDNPGTRDNVTRLLYFEDDMEVIGQAVNGREGIEMTVELKPHIVLMDINMPDMDGITATKEMGVDAPYSQVIIMSVQSDQHYMKQAMAAGARDFQPKPFTSDELVNCVRRVYRIGLPMYQQLEALRNAEARQAAQPDQAQEIKVEGAAVVAVYSPKGGVGASAISANLAVALHQEVGNVVLMDGAFQFGDILVHLNTRPTRTISDLVHDGSLEVDLISDILLPHDSGLKLLLAPPQPQLAEFITDTMISEIVSSLKKQFGMVVVDTNSQLTDRTLTILDTADYIVLVAVPELPSIKSVKLFLEVAEQLDFDRSRILVVINRANIPGGVRVDQIEKVLKLTETYRIPYDTKLHVALNKGVSIYQQDSGAPSAQAIADIARRLRQELTTVREAPVVEESA